MAGFLPTRENQIQTLKKNGGFINSLGAWINQPLYQVLINTSFCLQTHLVLFTDLLRLRTCVQLAVYRRQLLRLSFVISLHLKRRVKLCIMYTRSNSRNGFAFSKTLTTVALINKNLHRKTLSIHQH